jgi:hypothetical protein
MPRFKVAHVREQGVDLVIIPLESSFGSKLPDEQHQIMEEFQAHSMAAGLAGAVIPVWPQGRSMAFVAPRNWHPFFNSLSLDSVLANVNKELYW